MNQNVGLLIRHNVKYLPLKKVLQSPFEAFNGLNVVNELIIYPWLFTVPVK